MTPIPDTAEWNGAERRGIPIHVLNYMDERLQAHVEHVEEIFNAHIKDEMARYNDILETIKRNREQTAAEISAIAEEIEELNTNAQRRHDSLVQSLNAYSDGMNHKCQDVTSAFIKGPDGLPDFEGHRNDHDKRKKFGDWWDNVKDKLLTKILEWGALAFVVWVAHSLWEAFLKGPGK